MMATILVRSGSDWMRVLAAMFLVSTIALGQKRKLAKVEVVKIDTIDVLSRYNNVDFKEKNTFWADKNEIGLIQNQWYSPDTPDVGHAFELTVIFYNWNAVETGKDYDVSQLWAECEMKSFFSKLSFSKPVGRVRLLG